MTCKQATKGLWLATSYIAPSNNKNRCSGNITNLSNTTNQNISNTNNCLFNTSVLGLLTATECLKHTTCTFSKALGCRFLFTAKQSITSLSTVAVFAGRGNPNLHLTLYCVIYISVHTHIPILTLNGSPIPVVEETKFLGIIFDRKLSFIPHIKHLREK